MRKILLINMLANVLVILAITNNRPYENEQLKNTPVMFERIENALFYTSTWTIFTKFTPMDFSTVLNMIVKYEHRIDTLCAIMKTNSEFNQFCKSMIMESMQITKTLRQNNEHLQSIFTHKRNKRAIDIIGKFSKWAFGTMDSEDAHQIYNSLSTLEKKDANTFELIHHQISVMGSNFDKLSKPIQKMEKDLTSIAKNLRELGISFDNYRTNTNKEISSLKFKMSVYEYLTLLNSQLLEIQNHQATEMSILDDLYQSKLHPFLIDADNLVSTLKKDIEDSRKTFPMQDLYLLHQAAKIEVFPLDNHFIVKIVVPLPDAKQYMLQKVYTIPIKLNEKWDLLLPIKEDYIAEAKDHTTFVTLKQAEFEKCSQIVLNTSSSIFICKHNKPILTSGSTECLVDLIQHAESSKTTCKYEAIPSSEGMLVKMVTPNQWFYSFKNPFILDINCDDIHYTANLTNIGILKLLKQCEFTNKQVRIPFEKTLPTEFEYKQPEVDHSIIWDTLAEKFRNFTFKEIVHSSTRHELPLNVGNHYEVKSNLAEGKKSIEELQREWDQEEQSRKIQNQDWEISVHRVSMVTGGSTLITIIAIVVVILAIRNRRKKKDTSMSIQLNTISTAPEASGAKGTTFQKKKAPQPPTRKSIRRPDDVTFACV